MLYQVDTGSGLTGIKYVNADSETEATEKAKDILFDDEKYSNCCCANDLYDGNLDNTEADMKRVALEAELKLLTYLLDERTEHMYMQNPDSGEMTENGWVCNTSLSAVSANRIETERRKRIAELTKAKEQTDER